MATKKEQETLDRKEFVAENVLAQGETSGEPLDEKTEAEIEAFVRANAEAAAEEQPEASDEPTEEQVEEAAVYTKAEQAHYQEIKIKELSVGMLLGLYESVKAEAAFTKRVFDKADIELRAMIHAGPDNQQRLPFADGGTETNDAWRDEPISVLVEHGLPESALEKFAENHPALKTLGELADWQKDHKIGDVARIGESTAEKYLAADAAWWKAHPEYCETKEKTEEKTPETDVAAASEQE